MYAPRVKDFRSPLVADVGGAHGALVGARFARQEVVDARVAKQVPTLAVQLCGVHVQVLFVRAVHTTRTQQQQQHVSSNKALAAPAGATTVTNKSGQHTAQEYGSPPCGPSNRHSEQCVGPTNWPVRNSSAYLVLCRCVGTGQASLLWCLYRNRTDFSPKSLMKT